jgi:hypothetical protein
MLSVPSFCSSGGIARATEPTPGRRRRGRRDDPEAFGGLKIPACHLTSPARVASHVTRDTTAVVLRA